MEGVKKIQVEDTEILIIDYSDCKEDQMIDRLNYARKLILQENKPVLILTIFNSKCYATPRFVRQSEAAYDEAKHLILKNAITGLSEIQRIILKGFTFFGNRNLKEFKDVDESIRYLVKE